jgi:hypothetical protein
MGNGFQSLSFVVKAKGVTPEAVRGLRYSFKGLPAVNPPVFDEMNRLFYWRPEPKQVGSYKFTVMVKDPTGGQTSESVVVNVLKTATPEALPRGWAKMNKEDQYLMGRKHFPSTNFIEVDIAALPEYALQIKVRDSMDKDWLLTYIPKDGKTKINKKQKTATIMLGGEYAVKDIKKIRRNLYEDLYHYLGLIFKKIESIKITGAYKLKDFRIWNKTSLTLSAGIDKTYLPVLNLSFDDRFYQKTLYSKDDPMLISDIPVIKIDFNTSSGLVWRKSRLLIDKTEYHAARGEFSLVAVKPRKDASSFDVNYAMYMLKITADKRLPFGEHYVVFEARNAYGMLVSKEAYVRVVTLPSRVIGKPMVYPSPFSPDRHGEVSIQYDLTLQTNIEIVIFGVDGSVVMRRTFSMAEEGGRKGKNTVAWDGRLDGGPSVPNGIYLGVIIDKNENRILERFRLTVFR